MISDIVHLLYQVAIRPTVTNGCVVWQPSEEGFKDCTSKVQYLDYICFSNAMRTNTTVAMEIFDSRDFCPK